MDERFVPPHCGYTWECWHFAQTSHTLLGQVLLLTMAIGITMLVIEWIVRRFKL